MFTVKETKAPGRPELVRAHRSLGDFDLKVLSDGACLFDGGAIFGVVPKALWSRRMQSDEQNRILNTVVVQTGTHTVVIETGLGDKLTPKQREIYGAQGLLPTAFAQAAIRPEDVDVVINTHLHWDHCGWNTTRAEEGSVRPTFPNARYYAHRGEVEHGRRQLERDAVSYIADNYEPLVASGQMTLLDPRPDEEQEIVPGIAVELFPGHTRQMLGVHIESQGRRACYIADLIPTSAHLDLTWGMGFDLDPLTVIEQKKRFYARAIPNEWLLLFTHDHQTPLGRVTISSNGKPVLQAGE
jgi:glyoxylase-like metal-dependent hydrolase (beta-lactamase superfamily II)